VLVDAIAVSDLVAEDCHGPLRATKDRPEAPCHWQLALMRPLPDVRRE
jgi:hypothetical protein